MKLISFLGTANYLPTTYVWEKKEYATRLFPAAAASFVEPEKVLICATPTVREHANLSDLKKELEALGIAYDVISIPEAHQESDLWEVFSAITGSVRPGERVVFDVTNAFRSLPFLAFLVVAFLKTAQDVHVEKVLYGAFEARKPDENRTPVFDLTPFVSLLDWLTATDQFIKTGQAAPLAGLLEERAKTHHKPAANKAAKTLQDVSRAAFLCQPFELMRTVGALDSTLDAVESDFAPPFQMLSQQIVQEYGKFAAPDNLAEPDELPRLQAEYRLLNWYAEKGQLIQAVTLAREWLIDAVTWKLGQPLDFHYKPRQLLMEKAVAGLHLIGSEQTDRDTGEKYIFVPEMLNKYGRLIYDTWSEWETIAKVWGVISSVRNQLDHAQHQVQPMLATKLEKNVNNKILPGLQTLAKTWRII